MVNSAFHLWIIFHFATGDIRQPVDSMMACQVHGPALAEAYVEAHRLEQIGALRGWSCQIGEKEARA